MSLPAVVLRPEEPTADVFLGDIIERPQRRDQSGTASLRPIEAPSGPAGFPWVDPKKNFGLQRELPAASSASDSNSAHRPAAEEVPCAVSSTAPVSQAGLVGSHELLLTAADVRSLQVSTWAPQAPSGTVVTSSELRPVYQDEFLGLLQRVLCSSVAQQRLVALDVMSRELLAAESFRHAFLYGPNCADRVAALAHCIRLGNARVYVAAVTVLARLLAVSVVSDSCEAIGEIGVPLSDADETQQEQHAAGVDDNSSSAFEQVSEDLRLDVPVGLWKLGVPRYLLQNGIALDAWEEAACGGCAASMATTANAAQECFWGSLGVCVGSADAAHFVASHPLTLSQLTVSLQAVILGRQPLRYAVPVLLLLRKLLHHRRICFSLIAHLRPLCQLLISLLLHGRESSSSAAVSHANEDDDRTLFSVALFAILRCFIRHGCERIGSDFGPALLQLTGHGSLVVLELLLLVDSVEDAEVRGSTRDAEAGRNIRSLLKDSALQALGLLRNAGASVRTKSACTDLLRKASALHFLATYASVENIAAILGLLGNPVSTQTYFQNLLVASDAGGSNSCGGTLLSSQQLAAYFTSLQNRPNAKDVALPGCGRASVSCENALQVSLGHGLVRFLSATGRVFPSLRSVSIGFVDSLAARFVELMFSAHGWRDGERAAPQLSPEEISTVVEIVAMLSEDGPTKTALCAAGLLLHVIANTKQCLDAAPVVARFLMPCVDVASERAETHSVGDEKEETSVDVICAAVSGSLHNVDPTTSTAGWITAMLGCRPRLAANLIAYLLGTHPSARAVYRWDKLWADVLLWLLGARHQPSQQSKEIDAAMLSLCRVALAEGAVASIGVALHFQSALAAYSRSTEGGMRALTTAVKAGMCCAALLLPPEGVIAVVRNMYDRRQEWALAATATTEFVSRSSAQRCTAEDKRSPAADSAASGFGVLFETMSLMSARDKFYASVGRMQQQQQTSSDTWRWTLQQKVEFIQGAVPLCQQLSPAAWPVRVALVLLSELCPPEILVFPVTAAHPTADRPDDDTSADEQLAPFGFPPDLLNPTRYTAIARNSTSAAAPQMSEFEREMLRDTLQRCGWYNRVATAGRSALQQDDPHLMDDSASVNDDADEFSF